MNGRNARNNEIWHKHENISYYKFQATNVSYRQYMKIFDASIYIILFIE